MACARLLTSLITFMTFLSTMATSAEQTLFIGTNVDEHGIYASTLDLETGEFSPARAVGDAPRPGFLALHPTLPMLYAVTREQASPSGGVRAFKLEAGTSNLTLVGQQSAGDEGTTHLAIDPLGRAIIVANYSGGSTSMLPLNDKGSPGTLTEFIKHSGSSVNKQRQSEPHAHGVAIDAQGKFACVADLGTDEVIVYRVSHSQKLERLSHWKAKPGAGPRHLAFHPQGRWLYCINELDSTLTALTFDGEEATLTELQTFDTLPPDFDQANSTAEVVVHPNGRFVYISNRGHDSTAAFEIDAESGALSLVDLEPTRGGHPRFIGIDPSGRYLIAANRDANNLVSFAIDPHAGTLKPTGHEVNVPTPVCVVFPENTP